MVVSTGLTLFFPFLSFPFRFQLIWAQVSVKLRDHKEVKNQKVICVNKYESNFTRRKIYVNLNLL